MWPPTAKALHTALYPVRQKDTEAPAAKRQKVDEPEDEDDDDDEDGPSYLTPRTCALLYISLTICSDEAHMRDAGPLVLPPRAYKHAEREVWCCAFSRCFERRACRLAKGHGCKPNCSGEELALHIAGRSQMEMYLEEFEMGESPGQDEIEALPATANDFDYESLIEFETEDEDYLMLYRDRAPDEEDAQTTLADVVCSTFAQQQFGTCYLEPWEWFKPLRDARIRDHVM